MVRLSFKKIMPDNSDKLNGLIDKNKLSDIKELLEKHKGVVFALDDGEGFKAASVMVFEMNDEILTTALRKMYLADLFAADGTDSEYKGMMLEYTVNQAAYMGYDHLTVTVKADNLAELKFYAYHGFDKIVRVNEDEASVVLLRDVNAVMKCCGK